LICSTTEPPRKAHQQQAAVAGQRGQVVLEIAGADDVQDHVGAVLVGPGPHHLGEGFLAVVDGLAAQFADRLALAHVARRGEGAQTELAAQHQRRGADAAGAAVDQRHLAAPGAPELE
jgi:hypothetical protein